MELLRALLNNHIYLSSEQYFMELTQVQRTAVYTTIMKEYKMSKLVHTPETGGSLSGQECFISVWEHNLLSLGNKSYSARFCLPASTPVSAVTDK